LRKFGEIPEGIVRGIVDTMEECYLRLEPHGVKIVDLLLFKSSSAMGSFRSLERAASGVACDDFGDRFFTTHDAWRGTPRITVCLERAEGTPRLVVAGALRHEVGHSILHGSIDYYMFPVPLSLMSASERFGLPKKLTIDLLYLISIAVKDFEVTRLLSKKGYLEDQAAYSSYVLSTSEDDLTAWRIAGGNLAGMALCLAGRLKDVACAVALYHELDAALKIRDELSYLHSPVLERMLRMANELPRVMLGDTFQNVDAAVDVFTEHLLEPLFTKFQR